jgi:hypothetical protein
MWCQRLRLNKADASAHLRQQQGQYKEVPERRPLPGYLSGLEHQRH